MKLLRWVHREGWEETSTNSTLPGPGEVSCRYLQGAEPIQTSHVRDFHLPRTVQDHLYCRSAGGTHRGDLGLCHSTAGDTGLWRGTGTLSGLGGAASAPRSGVGDSQPCPAFPGACPQERPLSPRGTSGINPCNGISSPRAEGRASPSAASPSSPRSSSLRALPAQASPRRDPEL